MLQILALLILLLSSVIMLRWGKVAITSSVRVLTCKYTVSRRGPAMHFLEGGLYAGFRFCRNVLPNGSSNIVKGWLPIKHHIAACTSNSLFCKAVSRGKLIVFWVSFVAGAVRKGLTLCSSFVIVLSTYVLHAFKCSLKWVTCSAKTLLQDLHAYWSYRLEELAWKMYFCCYWVNVRFLDKSPVRIDLLILGWRHWNVDWCELRVQRATLKMAEYFDHEFDWHVT